MVHKLFHFVYASKSFQGLSAGVPVLGEVPVIRGGDIGIADAAVFRSGIATVPFL